MFIKFKDALIETTGICFFKTEPQQDVRPHYEIQLQSTINDEILIREEFESVEARDKRFAELEAQLIRSISPIDYLSDSIDRLIMTVKEKF